MHYIQTPGFKLRNLVMENLFRQTFLYLVIYFLLFFVGIKAESAENASNTVAESNFMVHIGAIFDADSTEGAAAEISMSLAISDFYALHSNYRTRVVLHIRNTKELVGTAAAGTLLIIIRLQFIGNLILFAFCSMLQISVHNLLEGNEVHVMSSVLVFYFSYNLELSHMYFLNINYI